MQIKLIFNQESFSAKPCFESGSLELGNDFFSSCEAPGGQIIVAAFTIFDTVLAYSKMFSTYVTLFIKFETKVCIDFKLAGF